jgi:hypothetical protein
MTNPFDALRTTLKEKLQPQAMRLLCGEMSAGEMRTSLALLNWTIRMCDRYEPKEAGSSISDAEILKRALQCVSRAKRSHPDSMSSSAMQSVEEELKREFMANCNKTNGHKS